ncbi:hypothetical protein [Streptomyces sp. NPDC029004]|uniref:hypothetical protein n=1 Tax=Streptomyces sp. NPDC029004 TaxID=3154490 RepID=UPI0033CE8A99
MASQLIVPMIRGYDFGIGAELNTGTPMSRVVEGERSTTEGSGGAIVNFALQRVHTTKELEQSLGIDVDLNLGCAAFGAGVSNRFSFAKNSKIQSSSLFMTITINMNLASMSIDEPVLTTPDASTLVDNPLVFAQRFGNMFVRGVGRGGLFVGVLRIETSSSEEAQSMSDDLSGSYGLFSGDAQTKLSNVQKSHQSDLSYLMYHEGGPVDLEVKHPDDPIEMLNNASLFIQSFHERPDEVAVPYDAVLAPITMARGPLPPNAADIQHAQDVLIFCSRQRSVLLDQLNLLQYIVDNPSRFDFSNGSDRQAIGAAATAKQTDVDLVADCASQAMNSPSQAALPAVFATQHGTRFPMTEMPDPLPLAKTGEPVVTAPPVPTSPPVQVHASDMGIKLAPRPGMILGP